LSGPDRGAAKRLRPVGKGEDAELDALFAEIEADGRTVANVQRVMGHNPSLVRGMAGLGDAVRFTHTLPDRWVELAILRLAIVARCPYPFSHHVPIALDLGFGEEQIARLVDWPDADCFDADEQLVLRATDEVERDAGLSDATFAALSERLTERQVLDLVMILAFYGLLVRVVNSTGTPVDDRVAEVVDRYWPFRA
jgi:4-carboxymuconolactone decarboxylase